MVLLELGVESNDKSLPKYLKSIEAKKAQIVEFGKGFTKHFEEPDAEVMCELWNYAKDVFGAVNVILYEGRVPEDFKYDLATLPAQFQVSLYNYIH